jgi:hypothetical protein
MLLLGMDSQLSEQLNTLTKCLTPLFMDSQLSEQLNTLTNYLNPLLG